MPARSYPIHHCTAARGVSIVYVPSGTGPPISPLRRLLLVLAFCLAATPCAWARDAFVLLSGGVSPLQNNYSQYLQARAVAQFFERSYPADSVWIFFGAGNLRGQAPAFGDVRRQLKKDGLVLESWLPGALKHNRPARREAILKALREEILPAVHEGGTLFLFVGDHGSQTRGKYPESTIDLWGVDPDPASPRGWKYAEHEQLTVGALRKVLAEGLGKGRLVFVMTQCFSGGFHFLGIPREPAANPAWFAGKMPKWARSARGAAPLPLAAGYTATDHDSFAAGCDPDPDPERWAGYERFLPEKLLGIDLFTLAPRGARSASFYAAHVEATLADTTIDKPQSTSERYLERWARLIETRLARDASLTPRVKRALARYKHAVDSGKLRSRDKALGERQAVFARYTRRLAEQAPTVKAVLTAGSRRDLEKTADPPDTGSLSESETKARAAANAERRKLWRETLRPAWREAVLAGAVPELADPRALEFEKLLIAEDERGRELMFASVGPNPLLPYLFGASGAARPASADPARAEVTARWGALRRRTIVAWAKGAQRADLKTAAAKAFPPSRRAEDAPEAGDAIDPDIAAERTLFYRRVLAAWVFLLDLGEKAALEQLQRLTALERTPLPPPRPGPG